MSWHLRSTSALSEFYVMLQVDEPDSEALNISLKVNSCSTTGQISQMTLQPRGYPNADTLAKRRLVTNILPVSPDVSGKKIPPLRPRIEV